MKTNRFFEEHGFHHGRMISGSKSLYRERNPDHSVVFNANIVTKKLGKIWFGDLDVTEDEKELKLVAQEIGEDLYILGEHDCRFGSEKDSIKRLIKKARYTIKK